MADADTNGEKPRGRPFEVGNRANPNGRPKGSRNKLGEAFLAALHEDFLENGKAAIEVCRAEKPEAYLKVIASILPKQAEITVNEYERMDDKQLRAALGSALRDLAALGVDIGSGNGPSGGGASAPEQTKTISPLH